MQKINYQKKLDEIISSLERKGEKPSLLLHSCCAPCSSYVLEYLNRYFQITVFYYNPNIYPKEEFEKRANEQARLISCMKAENKIKLIIGDFDDREFYNAVKGLENIHEGGERCFQCYRLRLKKTAELAQKLNFDYFTTTLSISPYKNAAKLNEISEELGEIYKVMPLPADFKKKGGYKRSIELSAQYGLYRQDYCGCIFSQNERREQILQRQHDNENP